MHAVVRAVLEQEGLTLVAQVVIDVSHLVVHREQLFLVRLDALLDANVVRAVHLPSTRVTLHVAIAGLLEH
ncbi:hypothetical protein D3C83_107910 [compost metagenome]